MNRVDLSGSWRRSARTRLETRGRRWRTWSMPWTGVTPSRTRSTPRNPWPSPSWTRTASTTDVSVNTKPSPKLASCSGYGIESECEQLLQSQLDMVSEIFFNVLFLFVQVKKHYCKTLREKLWKIAENFIHVYSQLTSTRHITIHPVHNSIRFSLWYFLRKKKSEI